MAGSNQCRTVVYVSGSLHSTIAAFYMSNVASLVGRHGGGRIEMSRRCGLDTAFDYNSSEKRNIGSMTGICQLSVGLPAKPKEN